MANIGSVFAGFIITACLIAIAYYVYIMSEVNKQMDDPQTFNKPVPEKYKKYPEICMWSASLGAIATAIAIYTPSGKNEWQ